MTCHETIFLSCLSRFPLTMLTHNFSRVYYKVLQIFAKPWSCPQNVIAASKPYNLCALLNFSSGRIGWKIHGPTHFIRNSSGNPSMSYFVIFLHITLRQVSRSRGTLVFGWWGLYKYKTKKTDNQCNNLYHKGICNLKDKQFTSMNDGSL